MKTGTRYSPEIRERAVPMVLEQQKEHSSQWATIQSIASKLGCTSETSHHGEDTLGPQKADWLEERRKQLHSRMRRRRKGQKGERKSRPPFALF